MSTYGTMGIRPAHVYRNLDPDALEERAKINHEGTICNKGALCVLTGDRTGRSAQDKFIVDTPEVHARIAWGEANNKPISQQQFNAIKKVACEYFTGKEVYINEGIAGADSAYSKMFLIINEIASQALAIKDLLIDPTPEELEYFEEPDYTILVAPNCKLDPIAFGIHSEAVIAIDFEQREVVICGTQYSGEIKKSVFTVMNYEMPLIGVLPMHCSANMDPKTGDTALFFGLSGTGKTTLSATPDRLLIGDDEHGWSDKGIFNFEGGCYAKCIGLREENEPEIYRAIRPGSVVENVVLNEETGEIDFDDASITENTRVAYPIEYIPNAKIPGVGSIPKTVVFLTADAFGVLPPISRLSYNAAMYYFLSGFTSKVAGTETGIVEPQPTFSTAFGEPFMPCDPMLYATMLGHRIKQHDVKVYLVNTGWSGGPYGKAGDRHAGKRISLKYTRAMVSAALTGELEKVRFVHNAKFNLDVPAEGFNGVPKEILNPRDTWISKLEYDVAAEKLAQMFQENFSEKYPNTPKEVREAGPKSNLK